MPSPTSTRLRRLAAAMCSLTLLVPLGAACGEGDEQGTPLERNTSENPNGGGTPSGGDTSKNDDPGGTPDDADDDNTGTTAIPGQPQPGG